MSGFILPESKSLIAILEMVMGDTIELEEHQDHEVSEAAYVGLFECDEGKLVAACLCSWEAACSLSCALSIIPPPVAEDMLKNRDLSPVALENLGEVMNMFSTLFMNDRTGHLRLAKVVESRDAPELAPAEQQFVTHTGGRYQSGWVGFVTL